MQSTQKFRISAKRSETTIHLRALATASAVSYVGAGFSLPRAAKGRALLSEAGYEIVANRMNCAAHNTILGDSITALNRFANRQWDPQCADANL